MIIYLGLPPILHESVVELPGSHQPHMLDVKDVIVVLVGKGGAGEKCWGGGGT